MNLITVSPAVMTSAQRAYMAPFCSAMLHTDDVHDMAPSPRALWLDKE